jgi:hypothetical protein
MLEQFVGIAPDCPAFSKEPYVSETATNHTCALFSVGCQSTGPFVSVEKHGSQTFRMAGSVEALVSRLGTSASSRMPSPAHASLGERRIETPRKSFSAR